jgi:hypothetical protein
VLFDGLGIDWQYEPEGYELPSQWYLPDFWLPQLKCFAEVKGTSAQFDSIAYTKARELCDSTGMPVILCKEITTERELLWTMFSDKEWLHCVDLMDSLKKGKISIRFDAAHIEPSDYARWAESAQRALSIRFKRNLRRQPKFPE